MKKYAIAIDVSPSEQLTDNDETIFCVAVLFGLKSPRSFDLVGKNFPIEEKRLTLRKYSGSSDSYKKRLHEHLLAIRQSEHVVTGVSVVNQRYVKKVGLAIWEKAHGKLPRPTSYSKRGKPRFTLGGYKKITGEEVAPYKVLQDDLCIIGWLASEVALVHMGLCEICGELVKLEALIDRLPNDQGPQSSNKAELLKWTINKLSDSVINIVGVPEKADYFQRELLVDNMAGLCREIMLDNKSEELSKFFSMYRTKFPTK